jgi:uncharacterized protein with gpF-like domain
MDDFAKKRESGWNSRFTADEHGARSSRSEYNALLDANMRHFFESQHMQKLLLTTGQIDRQGKVVDGPRAQSKLRIIDREFDNASKVEMWRKKAEEELRARVQARREQHLQAQLKASRTARIKEDKRIRTEIMRATVQAQWCVPCNAT